MANGKRGRASITLVPDVLRELRKGKGLSQGDIGERLVKQGVRRAVCSSETLTRGYQRIESSGRTSPKTALALAKLFGVSVEMLEGKEYPEPIAYEARMRSLLEEQHSRGDNQKLEAAIKHETEAKEDGLKSLAQNICRRIEKVQFARNPNELTELAELTGLSREQILEPANADGYWLVTISATDCVRADIVCGASSVISEIRQVVGDWLNQWGSDGTIRIQRDGNWYRLEVEQASLSYRMRADFIRCQPHAEGLRWVSPSRWDKYLLDKSLVNWAYTTANFVSWLDGIWHPADVRNLRFLVKEFTDSPPREIGQTVISTRIPKHVMDGFARKAKTHWITQKWLESELRDFLQPRLQQHSKRCWDISTMSSSENGIEVQFWPFPPMPDVSYGLRYRIQLVQKVAPAQFKDVPWRRKDRIALRDSIEKWLN